MDNRRNPKIRRTWGDVKPWTKIKPSDKIYNRKKDKDEASKTQRSNGDSIS